MREIDSKFSVDGDRIVKTSNGEVLPEDEPLFLLRARDHLALPLLLMYELLSQVDGCNDYHMGKLSETIGNFRSFAEKQPGRMKQPSITRGL